MRPRMIHMMTLGLMLSLLGLIHAQEIVLKDGRLVDASEVRRQQGSIVAVAAPSGEVTIPQGEIQRINFPRPPQLSQAIDLIVAGQVEEAIALIEPVVNEQVDFRDFPGNRWGEATLALVQALNRAGRGLEAEAVAAKLTEVSIDAEYSEGAIVQKAFGQLIRKDFALAAKLVEPLVQKGKTPAVRSEAFVVKGECLLAEQKWEEAMLSFLQVPVFYPGEKIALPMALLGRGRAHLGMEDFPGARAALEELRKTYPAAAEAKLAAKELERIQIRELGLSNPR